MANWLSSDLWDGADAVLLCSGMEENERFAQDLARAQERITPEWFDGLSPIVCQKLIYTAPYERFEGLRQLALKIQDSTGLRACFRGIVALDLSEWIGHEQDEYLKITFKYLHDHRQIWRSLFTFGAAEPPQILRMMRAAAPFLRPAVRQLYLFRDKALLQNYLSTQVVIQPKACAQLSEVLMASPILHNCSLAVQILDELSAGHSRITLDAVQHYLSRPGNLPSLLQDSPSKYTVFPHIQEKEA